MRYQHITELKIQISFTNCELDVSHWHSYSHLLNLFVHLFAHFRTVKGWEHLYVRFPSVRLKNKD